MTTQLLLGLTTLTVLLAAGCVADVPPEGPFTKEQARALDGSSDMGADICDLEGWYGDLECDDFCLEPDPDCAQCAAVPTCNAGEMAHRDVSDCPQDVSCREVTVCGATIWCSGTGTCPGVPSCNPGEQQHDRLEDCPQDDVICREVTECGATIWCSDTATCAAVPTCNSGETQVSSASECPADASCREVTECGATIWCWSDEAPVCAGDNPQGCISSGCAEGYRCDTTMGSAPSACDCDPENGSWRCTADLNGGVCVAE